MLSVFQKFGGIRPMAAKLNIPSSTVKSWHKKREIPEWRHANIMMVAEQHGIDLCRDELTKIIEDAPTSEVA